METDDERTSVRESLSAMEECVNTKQAECRTDVANLATDMKVEMARHQVRLLLAIAVLLGLFFGGFRWLDTDTAPPPPVVYPQQQITTTAPQVPTEMLADS